MVDFLRKILPANQAEAKKIIIRDIIPRGVMPPLKFERKLSPEKTASKTAQPLEKKTTEWPRGQLFRLPSFPLFKAFKTFKAKEKTEAGLTVRTWEPENVKRSVILRVLYRARKTASLRLLYAALAAGFLFVIIVMTTVFAKVTVTVRPISAKISIPKTALIAEARIHAPDAAAKKIPALRIGTEITERGTFPSSGKKYIEAAAKGTITLFNAFDSRAQVLIQNTRFVSPGGKVFKSTRTVTIPGARVEEGKIIPSSIPAEIIAEKPGEDYNVEPARFTIPGFKGTPKSDSFFGESKEPMSGGFRGEAKVVAISDIKAAQEKVTASLFERLKEELEKKIPTSDEFVVLDGSRSILINDLKNPKPEERLDEFTVEARGTAAIIIFKKSDLFSILGSLLLSPERPSMLIENMGTINFANTRLDNKENRLTFEVQGEGTAFRVIPSEEIHMASTAKRISKLESYLRDRPEIASFTIANFPSWRWATPRQAEAVYIKIELPDEAGNAN